MTKASDEKHKHARQAREVLLPKLRQRHNQLRDGMALTETRAAVDPRNGNFIRYFDKQNQIREAAALDANVEKAITKMLSTKKMTDIYDGQWKNLRDYEILLDNIMTKHGIRFVPNVPQLPVPKRKADDASPPKTQLKRTKYMMEQDTIVSTLDLIKSRGDIDLEARGYNVVVDDDKITAYFVEPEMEIKNEPGDFADTEAEDTVKIKKEPNTLECFRGMYGNNAGFANSEDARFRGMYVDNTMFAHSASTNMYKQNDDKANDGNTKVLSDDKTDDADTSPAEINEAENSLNDVEAGRDHDEDDDAGHGGDMEAHTGDEHDDAGHSGVDAHTGDEHNDAVRDEIME